MHHLIQQLGRRFWPGTAIAAACAISFVTGGCSKNEPPKVAKPAYVNIGLRPGLPAYLKDTVLERTDLSNIGPLAVSSYGLVVNLRYSGDSNTAPTAVRAHTRRRTRSTPSNSQENWARPVWRATCG